MAIAVQSINPSPELLSGARLELIEGGAETTSFQTGLEATPRSREECMLADVDDLARFRSADGGSYDQSALDSILQNKVTAVEEGAIPHKISEVRHQWIASPEDKKSGVIMDLGRTAVQTAMRGRLFYQYDESLARCDEEVAYAAYNQENLEAGVAHVMIAPRMTRKDASLEVAKKEGLAEADSIQINYLDANEAVTKSILAPDVPIQAWVDWLADPDNLARKSIGVEDPESALSVMRTFSQLNIPLEKLPEGPVTILESVLPHIKDLEAYQKVLGHIQEFRGNQEEKGEIALNFATRWRDFDIALDQSDRTGFVSDEVEDFIYSLKDRWSDEDQTLIDNHKIISSNGAAHVMTRELAIVLQNAKRNMILTSAAVVAGNSQVLKQIDPEIASYIYQVEKKAQEEPGAIATMELMARMNSLIASQNVKVGGGCSGINEANFRTNGEFNMEVDLSGMSESMIDRLKKEAEEVDEDGLTLKCVNCPECTTFHDEVKKENGKYYCKNSGCKLSKRKNK